MRGSIKDRPLIPATRRHLRRFIMNIGLAIGSAVIVVLIFLLLFSAGCSLSPQESNERAAREEYARGRAGCYETAGYWGDGFNGCMKGKGWRE